MTAKLDYTWNLREVMAGRGMFNTADIRPLLAERGISLSRRPSCGGGSLRSPSA